MIDTNISNGFTRLEQEFWDNGSLVFRDEFSRYKHTLYSPLSNQFHSRHTDQILTGCSQLPSIKNLVESCHTGLETLSEFLSDVSASSTVSLKSIIEILQKIDNSVVPSPATKDVANQTRTDLSAIKALLNEALKVKSSFILFITQIISFFQSGGVLSTSSTHNSHTFSTPGKSAPTLPTTPLSAPAHSSKHHGRSKNSCSECGDTSHYRRDCPVILKKNTLSEFCVRYIL